MIPKYFHKLMNGSGIVFELTRSVILVLLIALFLHYFIVSIYPVRGISMQPNLVPQDFVLVSKLFSRSNLQRGDIVITRFGGDTSGGLFVKRIVGLPGETVTVKGGTVSVNGTALVEPYVKEIGDGLIQDEKWELGSSQYFAIGDNRPNSSDSRVFGPVTNKDIIAKAVFVLWPKDHIRYLGN